MIDFAGCGLSAPTPDLEAFLAEWWDSSRADSFSPAGWYSRQVDHFPRPYPPRIEPPKLGRLRWPTGASRWATFYHLARQSQLEAIRTAIGSTPSAKTLTISDGTNSITPSMWMLPPRPVARLGSDELWLICLVDERYWWWQAGDQAPSGTTYASWSALFSDLFTKVGVGSPTIETIPSAYSTPSDRWAVGPCPIPLLLDAAASLTGSRVVRRLDGSVRTVRAATATVDTGVEYTAHLSEKVSGGLLSLDDIALAVPEEVAIVFYDPTSPVTLTRTLTACALSGYGSAAGVVGRVGTVWADMAATVSSGTRGTLADEAAKDFYRWGLADVEATFRGVVPWVFGGAEDAVEWEAQYLVGADGPHLLTRVTRPPLNGLDLLGANPISSSGVPIGSAYIPFPCRVGSNDAGSPPKYTLTSLQCSAAGVWSDVTTVVTLGAFQQLAPGGATPGVVPFGTRAIGWKDAVTGTFLFVVADEASATGPGWVTTLTQTFDGDKTFLKNVVADTFRTTHGYTGGFGYDVDSLGDARFQQNITVTKAASLGTGNPGNLGGVGPLVASDYRRFAIEVVLGSGAGVGSNGREVRLFDAQVVYSFTYSSLYLFTNDPTQGALSVNGGLYATSWNVFGGTPGLAGADNTKYMSGVFSGTGSTLKFNFNYNTIGSVGEYDPTNTRWKFSQVVEAATRFRVNGSDGGTATTGGLVFEGGLYKSGTFTGSTITTSTPTNGTGILSGDGSTIFFRTLTAPAAGFTISNPTGAAGNPIFALADDLAALEAMSGTGLVARTAANTYAQRTITGPAAGLTFTNGDGVAGNPTAALANDLAALEGLGSTGIAVRTAADTWAQRTITSSDSSMTVTNGDGVAGNIDLIASSVPVGTVVPFAGITVPSGWLLCDGSAVSRTTYANLFAAMTTTRTANAYNASQTQDNVSTTVGLWVGLVYDGPGFASGATIATIASGTVFTSSTTSTSNQTGATYRFYPYGRGDGSTTFNVPDFRRRVPVGSGGSGTSTLGANLGQTGGAETHTLATSEIPSHSHAARNRTGVAGGGVTGWTGVANDTDSGVQTGTAGGGGSHNNLQPSIVMQFIIKT